ncbi:peroxisome biogenesis factor, putative [Ixodes scapularis]|uniref:Peroxisome biogenesis factor, putative n=1 Tax=Ixodes scapularis TaxID=6945 RepID=B7P7P4_IXOSC|nr:peroxisome biogenesis factor, putative [Ixodes scapularis]|eukprot:XP_002399437.1 peroxisome biogenesis factor, putative [Ixodes scapularis]
MVEREDMLRSLVQMRPHLEGNFSIRDVASKTEGCLARDLVAILDRATHSACLAFADNEDLNKLELTDDDFESALEEFCPSSLRGLNLRTEDTLSWDDAGGLEGVKKTLQEVFFWPTKGPELLSKYIGASEQAVRNVFQR